MISVWFLLLFSFVRDTEWNFSVVNGNWMSGKSSTKYSHSKPLWSWIKSIILVLEFISFYSFLALVDFFLSLFAVVLFVLFFRFWSFSIFKAAFNQVHVYWGPNTEIWCDSFCDSFCFSFMYIKYFRNIKRQNSMESFFFF